MGSLSLSGSIRICNLDTKTIIRAEECARHAAIVNATNRSDPELLDFLDAAADLAKQVDALEAKQRE